MSVGELICTLHAIVAENSIDPVLGEDTCLNWGYISDRHRLIQDAVDLADRVLIKSDGDRNYLAETQVEMAGFPVRALEKDGFGWLVGGIETEKGVIAYG
jgi:hypothetical protein